MNMHAIHHRHTHHLERVVLMVGVLVAMMLCAGSAYGQAQANGTGNVEVHDQLNLNEISPIDFGQIDRPTTGSNTFELYWILNGRGWGTTTLTTSGGGDATHLGNEQHGRYMIRGPRRQVVQVTASIAPFNVPGIIVERTFVNGRSDTQIEQLDGTGYRRLRVGGVITVTSSAALGAHTTDVYVTANFP
ncbi:hypothetical protein [Persicimonas caeni]|uniref:hypothetical protein n=1 Tax=Persicimonas caeni TaxID=2292766 RepID=UPI00143D2C1B|nr:hypothetical protein [Persicimonas caeni]